ncbi:hypothetical protein SY212_03480 [Ligilactobacillus agilis]|uniref:Uncharacterized protein n=1 Tax=Ligilactobacillus agilis TaxID=1601 RepID=A0A6F9XJF2_9LACO|nr:hypothetical protein [Ligilactobacillus agilis]GET05318.1 hypothetical protein SY212_03480 [Ligilactobacillus agilis]
MGKTENGTLTLFDKRTGEVVMTTHLNNYNEPSYDEPTASIRNEEIIIKILHQAYADKMIDENGYSTFLQRIKDENNHSVAVIKRDNLGLLLTIYTLKGEID